jgi:hypothetical protein
MKQDITDKLLDLLTQFEGDNDVQLNGVLVVESSINVETPQAMHITNYDADAIWISLARKQLTKAENEFVNKL